jgi:hypothetical protein
MIPSKFQFPGSGILQGIKNRVGVVAREARDMPTAFGNIARNVNPTTWSENAPSLNVQGGVIPKIERQPGAGDWMNRMDELPKNKRPQTSWGNIAQQTGDIKRAIFTGKPQSPSKQFTSANPGILTSGTNIPGEKRKDK